MCVMAVGEASIKLIADHCVNFSYLEKPQLFLNVVSVGDMTEERV